MISLIPSSQTLHARTAEEDGVIGVRKDAVQAPSSLAGGPSSPPASSGVRLGAESDTRPTVVRRG
jgi:hypothetical protein